MELNLRGLGWGWMGFPQKQAHSLLADKGVHPVAQDNFPKLASPPRGSIVDQLLGVIMDPAAPLPGLDLSTGCVALGMSPNLSLCLSVLIFKMGVKNKRKQKSTYLIELL